jgi:hypothetical protein
MLLILKVAIFMLQRALVWPRLQNARPFSDASSAYLFEDNARLYRGRALDVGCGSSGQAVAIQSDNSDRVEELCITCACRLRSKSDEMAPIGKWT